MKNRTMQEDDEIIIRLDVMLAFRKMTLQELGGRVGMHITNLSILKNGKAKLIKLTTLMRICKVLACTPNDILQFRKTGSAPAMPKPPIEMSKSEGQPWFV